MTPISSSTESFLSEEESLARENTQKMIALIDEAYDSIKPKDDRELLANRIYNYLEDAENGCRDDINPVRRVQRLWEQDDNLMRFIGLGLLIKIAREKKDPAVIERYKEYANYVSNLDHVFCNKPRIVITQEDESTITTILALPFHAKDILTNIDITDEDREQILSWLYYQIKRRNEEKE
jgi:hypothetical protein